MEAIEEELKKLGVSVGGDLVPKDLKVDVNDAELNKELEGLLNNKALEVEAKEPDIEANILEEPIDDEHMKELDKMMSQINLASNNTDKIFRPKGEGKVHSEEKADGRERLEEQITKCGKAFEFYTRKNRKEEAILFGRRKRAFEEDLKDLTREPKHSGVGFVNVNCSYQMFPEVNSELTEEDLQVNLLSGALGSYRIGIILEFYSERQTKQLVQNTCILKFKRNDLRILKFFEHRRITVCLIEEYAYLFFLKGFRTIASTTLKIDPLLSKNQFRAQLSLKGINLSLEFRVKRAINSSTSTIKIAETWTVPTTGRSIGLWPEIKAPKVHLIPLEEIKSYNGLEYEISLCQGQSSLKERLMILEAQRDMMLLQVQMGKLDQSQYRLLLISERDRLKNLAVKGSDKAAAKAYFKHYKLIEQELAEMN